VFLLHDDIGRSVCAAATSPQGFVIFRRFFDDLFRVIHCFLKRTTAMLYLATPAFPALPAGLNRVIRPARACASAWRRLRWLGRSALQALAVVALQLAAVSAFASPFTDADARAVRTVVEAQLAAFAVDDAAKAFSYAAPNVREAVGTPAGFMAMVQSGYPVVYRPASVAFLKANGKDDDVIQRVQMTDASGESWLAIYSLQRQKNKTWRITGCSVVENKGRMA
jgi:Domain of unknown function (DUF4864)